MTNVFSVCASAGTSFCVSRAEQTQAGATRDGAATNCPQKNHTDKPKEERRFKKLKNCTIVLLLVCFSFLAETVFIVVALCFIVVIFS